MPSPQPQMTAEQMTAEAPARVSSEQPVSGLPSHGCIMEDPKEEQRL
jgi:hypothetical protein